MASQEDAEMNSTWKAMSLTFAQYVCMKIYKILVLLADTVEDVFWPDVNYRSRGLEIEPSEASQWTFDEAYDLSTDAYFSSQEPDGDTRTSIYRFGRSTVLKSVMVSVKSETIETCEEFLAMQLVQRYTTIPIPRVHPHLCSVEYGTGRLVMDWIDGETLKTAWPKLSFMSKLRVAWTLRSYIRQLRRIPCPQPVVPGPPGTAPKRCGGRTFEFHRVRPRAYPDTDAFFSAFALQQRRDGYPPLSPEATNCRWVFTHNDLHTENIILDKDGRVWLIDWGWAGFYPEYYEYLSLAYMVTFQRFGFRPSWICCFPFIADPYLRIEKEMCGMCHSPFPYRPPWDELQRRRAEEDRDVRAERRNDRSWLANALAWFRE